MTEPPSPGYYEFLDFNAPLSDQRADAIARSLADRQPARIVDVRCGWGELLLRTVAMAPTASGLGVDTDTQGIERGRANTAKRGLSDRVTFSIDSATEVTDPADVVICIGSDPDQHRNEWLRGWRDVLGFAYLTLGRTAAI